VSGRPWTDQELTHVRLRYGIEGPKCGKAINRSEWSTQSKASEMGLSKSGRKRPGPKVIRDPQGYGVLPEGPVRSIFELAGAL